jgi:curved DNA-binding protein CbpA
MDLYDILEINETENIMEIKKAYKRLAIKYHPDKNKNKQDIEKYHSITMAYKILSDPKLLSLRQRTYIITLDDLEKPGIGTKLDCWGVTRPHIDEFLMFCFS